MNFAENVWNTLIAPWRVGASSPAPRRRRRTELSWDCFEDRVVLSRFGGGFRHEHALNSALLAHAGTSALTSARGATNSTANTALTTALQTLRSDVETIEAKSSTTVAELTAIRTAFRTLKNDGLTPSSQSALSSFENGLVTAAANGTTLSGNASLLSQFTAIYTASPTTQQTTDLTTAYEALATAVTAANITSSDITTIDTDFAAVQSARGSSSTATYPYFSLVTGGEGHLGGGFGGGCH